MANWTNVTREPETGLPTMLVQAVSIAFVMCVCELVSAPVMVSAAGGAFALMPWFLVACLFAVAFVYTVGFVLLWAADSFAARLKRRDALMPLIYAATMNSIITRAGLATLSQGDSLMIGINCAVVGLAAFFLGTAAMPRVMKSKGRIAVTAAAVIALAVFGGVVLAMTWSHLA